MLFFPLCLPLLSVANISLAFPWQNCHSDSFLLPVSSFSPRPLPLTCTHTNTHNVHLTASFLFTISFWNEITLCRYSFSSCDFLSSCKSCHCKEGGRENIQLETIFSKATFLPHQKLPSHLSCFSIGISKVKQNRGNTDRWLFYTRYRCVEQCFLAARKSENSEMSVFRRATYILQLKPGGYLSTQKVFLHSFLRSHQALLA